MHHEVAGGGGRALGGSMQQLRGKRKHAPEPQPGSFRAVTGDGDDADLFNLNHYPVHAVCRVCSEPIQAEAFLRAFRHEELQLSPGGTTPRNPPVRARWLRHRIGRAVPRGDGAP